MGRTLTLWCKYRHPWRWPPLVMMSSAWLAENTERLDENPTDRGAIRCKEQIVLWAMIFIVLRVVMAGSWYHSIREAMFFRIWIRMVVFAKVWAKVFCDLSTSSLIDRCLHGLTCPCRVEVTNVNRADAGLCDDVRRIVPCQWPTILWIADT